VAATSASTRTIVSAELRSWLLKVDCDPNGGMEVDRDFFIDFHDRAGGPARAHEVRLEGGDCTTEIFQ
jgi:methanethiol oxidase